MSARRHLAAVPTDPDAVYAAARYGLSDHDRRTIDDHLDWCARRGLSSRTIDSRRAVLDGLAGDLSCDLLAVHPRMLDAWQSQLVRRPMRGNFAKARPGETLSANSLANYTMHVRSFYRWAFEDGRTAVDLAARLPAMRRPVGEAHPIPEGDLIAALEVAGEPVRTFLILAAFMGLRAGEIARVRGDSIVRGQSDRLVLSGVGKGAKPFRLIVPRHVEPVLAPLMRSPGPAFRRASGEPASSHWVTRTVSAFFKAQGMPYTCHWARHSFGTAVYQQTRDLLLTQEVMRHSTPGMTRIYVETAAGAGTEATDALAGRMLGGAS